MNPEEYKEVTSQNYRTIKSHIRNLAEFCDWFSFQPKKFWPYTKVVNKAFSNFKPLTTEDRKELWDDFQELCRKAKELGEKEREDYTNKSKAAKEDILYYIKEAKSYAKLNNAKAQELLGKAMSLIKSSKLTKEDNDTCFERWKSVKDDLSWERKQKGESNYRHIKSLISDMSNKAFYGDAKEALTDIKNIQSQLRNYPMEDVYWKEVKESLANYWNKAKSRLDEDYRKKQQDWESNQREYREKQANWRNNQEKYLDKFQRMVSDNENYIEKLRDQINDLESDISNAWNDDFKNRARGWVSEKEAKISEVQTNISELEYKIKDIRNSLNG